MIDSTQCNQLNEFVLLSIDKQLSVFGSMSLIYYFIVNQFPEFTLRTLCGKY